MYANAQPKTKPQSVAHHAALGEDEILEQLRSKNVPLSDPKAILDKIKLLNPKLKNPHLLVGKYRALKLPSVGSNSGASSGEESSPVTTAPKSRAYPADIVDGALYLYSTNSGAFFINSLIRKEKGQDIDIPDATNLAGEARRQFKNGSSSAVFAPGIDINNVIRVLSKKGHAIEVMNQAAQEAKFSGMNSYYRGTMHRPVLNAIKPGDLVSTNFFMSVTGSKETAEKFSSGKYNSKEDADEFGVTYAIVGNPKAFRYGISTEAESVFPVGTKFKYIGNQGSTFNFVEQSPAEVEKYKGNVYRLYR
jgi:hypothetical protein